MTRLSLSELRHLQTLRTHAFGYLSDLRDLELRAPVSQEDDQLAWNTLHRGYLENLVQVVFQYFRTLNPLEALQESTRRHLIEPDQATNLPVLLNEQTQENDSDQEDEDATGSCGHYGEYANIAPDRHMH